MHSGRRPGNRPTRAPPWPGWHVLAASPAFSAMKAFLSIAEGLARAIAAVVAALSVRTRLLCSLLLWSSRGARWRSGREGRRKGREEEGGMRPLLGLWGSKYDVEVYM